MYSCHFKKISELQNRGHIILFWKCFIHMNEFDEFHVSVNNDQKQKPLI